MARRTRGPLAEMLLDAGYTAEHTRRVVRTFTRGIPDMPLIVGRRHLDAAELACEQAIARRGGAITYQVRVFTSNKDFHKERGSCRPQYEHLVEVLVRTPREARLVAAQMAACHTDDPMPLAAEVVTDSTLCVL